MYRSKDKKIGLPTILWTEFLLKIYIKNCGNCKKSNKSCD